VTPLAAAGLVAGAYLLGSISFSVLLVRALRRADPRTIGSRNPGATNVLRTSGRWPALVVLALDMGKGLLPVQLGRRLGAPAALVAGAALAAVIGHVFPVFFGFRGGKGVATGFGALLGLYPLAAAVALLVFLFVVTVTRYVSLGSVVAAVILPLAAWASEKAGLAWETGAWPLAFATGCSALVVARHLSNLRRIAAGDELRLGEEERR